MIRSSTRRTAIAALLALATAAAHAATFPSRPIRLLVGASAGGTTDTLAREIAEDMTKTLGQPVIVENKPGAGGNIAAQEVARAAADGHTLLVSFTSHTMNASLMKKLPYDPIADFTPIALLAKVSSVLVTRADAPYRSLADVLAKGKSEKQGLTFAIGGTGSSLHMDTYEFELASGIKVTQIPFKGTSPALADVLAGHVDLMFAPANGARPLVNSGKLRALAVASTKRIAAFPDAPPITEAVPKYTTNNGWFGVLGPAKLPADVTRALNAAVNKAMEQPKVKARLEADGSSPELGTPEQFGTFLAADLKHWAAQAKAFGIKPE
ncbi:MAG TPA: tripartite tricarboxylate transporter substrate binding protein [Ramlibacter sp.]|uniref:Bug family tripartite tricarboxylate transporter substrate binding protein n=1 Tax=Ramlibacter sp. TaxID=1917967 RepID=UPI002D7E5499|nr:tripartite tricarboxylate transporter substrate binding protein [Ramlibacter sp.]HET8748243.1 tripartite tricarboxylate transporter substrate binding protein [Ramlibacter sp.]